MLQAILSDALLLLGAMGPWAYPAASLLMAVVAVLPIPAEAPAMINGMLFGPWVGTAVTWTGAMIGAHLSFELSRALGRPLAERLLRDETLEKADSIVLEAGWPGLLVARFVPLVAFTAVNWAAGLTPIRRWTFAWTTAVGILPGAFLFTASGAGMSSLLTRHPWATGAIATLVLGALLLRAYREAEAGAHLGAAASADLQIPGHRTSEIREDNGATS